MDLLPVYGRSVSVLNLPNIQMHVWKITGFILSTAKFFGESLFLHLGCSAIYEHLNTKKKVYGYGKRRRKVTHSFILNLLSKPRFLHSSVFVINTNDTILSIGF